MVWATMYGKATRSATAAEARSSADLSRAGKRLMGFCRTNLFKRLESSGEAFICFPSSDTFFATTSILHAIENDQPFPSARKTPAYSMPDSTDAGLRAVHRRRMTRTTTHQTKNGSRLALAKTSFSAVARPRCTTLYAAQLKRQFQLASFRSLYDALAEDLCRCAALIASAEEMRSLERRSRRQAHRARTTSSAKQASR